MQLWEAGRFHRTFHKSTVAPEESKQGRGQLRLETSYRHALIKFEATSRDLQEAISSLRLTGAVLLSLPPAVLRLVVQTLLLSGSLTDAVPRRAYGPQRPIRAVGHSALSSAYDLSQGGAGSGSQLWMMHELGNHFGRFRERGRINDVDISREEATPDVGGCGGRPLTLGP
ncbi:hypothetical protein FIBSPDRAFT_926129 [Athelia psychrophila]|uniref:Uncharacterized protein n=1 Tax=Athelia psychrophila TaxID=1759441 RepID=A0A166TWX0_9AGAM|nr:hypothetical protein FIBSPDRAFT_926129 [Fibularhizoctonia sp. CBS 109695]